MPKRIPFHIVYATSEDPSYPACELNQQGPGARGWRSAADARPPHELLLRLGCVANLHRLQLLAHHQLVPSSVEVLVSGGVVSEGAATPCGAAYTAVGRVTLAAPEPHARTRELRSAALGEPTTARFVKLRLSAPHPPNREDDQVALMAVNVIGDEVEETTSSPTAKETRELPFSPYDDLAFVMYVDNEVADVVRGLDRRKQAAVAEERFEYARRLKSASSALVSAGSRIGRWRLRMRIAAAREDFELARHMRDRIADALAGIQEDTMICRLMEDDGPDPRNDSSMHQEYDFSHHLSPSVVSGCLSLDIPSPVPPDTEKQENDVGGQGDDSYGQGTCLGEQVEIGDQGPDLVSQGNELGDKESHVRGQDDDVRCQDSDLGQQEGQRIDYDSQEHDFVPTQYGEEVDYGKISHTQAKTDSIQEYYSSEASLTQEYKLKQKVIEDKIEEQKRTEQKMLEEHRLLEETKLKEHKISNENRVEETRKDSLNEADSLSYTQRREEEYKQIEGKRLEELKREHRNKEFNREELQMHSESKEDILRIEEKIIVQIRDDQRTEEELRKETDSPRRSITPNAANGSVVRRRNKSAGPRSTFEAHEESILPALRHSHTNEYLRGAREEEYSAGSASSIPQRAPHKLNERERKHAALPILIFGYPLVEKFYSKNFIDKEEGLARLRSELTTPSGGSTKTSPNKTARAAAILLQRALRDKVYSVYSQANEGVKALFQLFVPDRVCAAETQRCLEKLVPELLRACGDPAPRVHSTAQHTLLTVADCQQVRSLHYIPQQLVRAVPASMHPRLALSRLQMLEQLLLTHGISTDKNSGLTVRRLAECGASGAQHAASSVRAAAERILLVAYERSPRIVRAQLPPDDAVTRRNLIYRHLFQQFDRIDMQKMLNQAPTEQELDQSQADSILETASLSQSTRSTGMTSSLLTSTAATSSYSLKSMASSASGTPSSLNSYATKSKSSLKKSPTKKYSPSLTKSRDFSSSLGYNKLRLDSAVSPKHSPRAGSVEKVHFQETHSEVVYRRNVNPHPEHRHSMIHYDHEPSKPTLRERPTTVYEPLHIDYSDSPTIGSPRTSKNDLRDQDFRDIQLESPRNYRGSKISISDPKTDLREFDFRDASDSSRIYRGSPKPIDLKRNSRDLDFRDTSLDSPRTYRGSPKTPVNDLKSDPRFQDGQRGRFDSDRSLDSPKSSFHGGLESPKLVAGVRNLQLNIDEGCPMDESGYYSPGRRQQMPNNENQMFESYEAAGEASCVSTPEPTLTSCSWCGRRVRPSALETHYWRRCVVLARCPHCRLAIEARALHAHLLEECSMSEGAWKQCHQCAAALRTEDKGYHNCIALSLDEWKCPYCLTNVLARELPWQRHLMQCPRNPRLSNTQ